MGGACVWAISLAFGATGGGAIDFFAIAIAGATFSSAGAALATASTFSAGGVKKLNMPLAGSSGVTGALIGAPDGIWRSSSLAASAFAEARDGREAIITFFASISSGSCLNIAMFNPSGDFLASFLGATAGTGAGDMNAFAIAGGAVG